MSWEGSILRSAIEAGDFETAARQYAEDAILDVTVDLWRFQVRGREAIEKRLAEDYAGPVVFRRWVERPTSRGAGSK
jgi:ketosteroid isomerase-like protein